MCVQYNAVHIYLSISQWRSISIPTTDVAGSIPAEITTTLGAEVNPLHHYYYLIYKGMQISHRRITTPRERLFSKAIHIKTTEPAYFRTLNELYRTGTNPGYFLQWNKWAIRSRDIDESKILTYQDLYYIRNL